MEEIHKISAEALGNGYEGLIIRKATGKYEYSFRNYHSSEILKMKPTFDKEYKCIGYTNGKGKDAGAVIWVCEVAHEDRLGGKSNEDYIFNVVPNMPLEERKRVFRCLQRKTNDDDDAETMFDIYVLGKPLTVEYQELSETGVPLRAKGKAFRTYEDETDPIREMYEECCDA
jgi:ATP-dependent DNA ligase